MAQQTWTFDAPSGVYKSHTLSSDLRQAAIVDTKFMQFVKPEAGYGRKKGDTITITRVSNLTVPTDGTLAETTRIPEDVLTISTTAITVAEWGRSVPYTSLSEDLSEFNVENSVQAALKNQMKVVMDNAAAAAFKTGQIKVEQTGVSSVNFDTGGTATGAATANLNFYAMEQIRDYLYSTLYVPPYEGDDYIGLVSTFAARGIKQDPSWETWHKYTDPEAKYNAEIGRMENIRVVESPNVNALKKNAGTSTTTGEAVFFGMDPVVMAVCQDPELRVAIPQDFGRQKNVAWYGILQFGIVWTTSTAGEARIIHYTST
jgi:N4-gp56 family major capsid protein